ncbi:MAG TPA: sulfotransferase [Rubrobacteraceae bacterium]|nr:sulfotransferase [Rubrobacteraceae bacterium]
MRVVGAGFGRTGTMSLKVALEELGYAPCYHMIEVFAHPEHAPLWQAAWRGEPVDWEGFLGGYEAAVDWPACSFYEELMERYPEAKVILTVRDPERWYESTRSTIYELSMVATRSPLFRLVFGAIRLLRFGRVGRGNMADEIIWDGTFDGKFENRRYAMDVFERHNAQVRRRVPPDRLLVYEVREGWAPLCEFLGVKEPDTPFPHVNDTAEMRRRIRAVRALSVAVPAALTLLGAALLMVLTRRARA